jgi:hypothetical protein
MKEVSETVNIFDYLMELFPKIQDKKRRLNDTYNILYPIYKKIEKEMMASDGSNDKEFLNTQMLMKKEVERMKSILKLISATKKGEPTESFLQTLKERAVDKYTLVLTLIALQPFFKVTFKIINQTENFTNFHIHEETQRRWDTKNGNTILKVDIESHAFLGEDNLLSVIPEESFVENSIPVKEPDTEYKVDQEEPEVMEPEVMEPSEEPEVIEEPEPTEEPEVIEEPEPIEEVMDIPVTRPEPVRRGKTPKSGVSRKTKPSTKSEIRGTSMNTVIGPVSSDKETSEIRGTSLNSRSDLFSAPSISLNDVVEPVKTKSKARSKTIEGKEPESSEKIKLKVHKIKTKPKTKSLKKSETIEE